jgi:threonine synthase
VSFLTGLACIRCGGAFGPEPRFDGCPRCRVEAPSNLTPTYDYQGIRRAFRIEALRDRPSTMWRYREFLPPDEAEVVTLAEGMTPLLPAPRLGSRLGVPGLFLKDESRNPTWSFKDRLAVTALAMGRRFGARTVGVSSSGNAGAAAAAYAARAGLPCVVFTFQGAAGAMLTQMRAYGAYVVATAQKADRWTLLQACIDRWGWYPTSPFFGPPIGSNPYGVDGYKTIAFELCEQLGWRAPDWCVLPVAYGDALFGAWKGFREFADLGLVPNRPRLAAAEIYGSLERALLGEGDVLPEMPSPTPTLAHSIGTVRSTYQALHALRQGRGLARTIEDEDLLHLQKLLAVDEGLYAEPSSVASLAAIWRLRSQEIIGEHETVVAVLTASGLKDPEPTAREAGEIPLVTADLAVLRDALMRAYGFAMPL